MDVKENVEVPLLGRVLRQWHTLTWHHLEVLRTERRKKRRSLRESVQRVHTVLTRRTTGMGCYYNFLVDGQLLHARMGGSRNWLVPGTM